MQGRSANLPDHGRRAVAREMNHPAYDCTEMARIGREAQVIGGLLHGLPIALFLWIGLIGASALVF